MIRKVIRISWIEFPHLKKRNFPCTYFSKNLSLKHYNTIQSVRIDKLYNFHGKPHKLFMVQLVPMSTINYKSHIRYIWYMEMAVRSYSWEEEKKRRDFEFDFQLTPYENLIKCNDRNLWEDFKFIEIICFMIRIIRKWWGFLCYTRGDFFMPFIRFRVRWIFFLLSLSYIRLVRLQYYIFVNMKIKFKLLPDFLCIAKNFVIEFITSTNEIYQ